ncbi:MAG: hypothetical protein IT349_20470, partial [Candidatus Eisenbacteria bacterium]|nr:hypothetical protein [Candidatus Eisenbacteria bacterium]
MNRSFATLSLAIVLCAHAFLVTASAGPNAGGVLVVHAGDDVVYTTDHSGYCDVPGSPHACSSLDTNLPADPGRAQVWWVMACFPEESQPRVKAVEFGVQYDQQLLGVVDWGECDGFAFLGSDWPASGTGAAIVFAQTRTERVFPFYWFAGYVYGEEGFGFRLGEYPGHGGNFADDSSPGMIDPVAGYGVLGFGDHAGYLPCPGDAGACCLADGNCVSVDRASCAGTWLGSSVGCQDSPCGRGACCLSTGQCTLTDEADCSEQGGTYQGALTPCEPQPCVPEAGACCVQSSGCKIVSRAECEMLGGSFVWPGTVCDPAPCALPEYTLRADGTGQLPTIQAAINAADAGAVIHLADGTYRGHGNHDLDFGGKALTVRSLTGTPQSCVIDCESRGRGFVFDDGEGPESIVEGVTIAHGRAAEGGAVEIRSSGPRFSQCWFIENQAVYGGAIMSRTSTATFENCTFAQNHAEAGGAMNLIFGGLVEVRDCYFLENVALEGEGAGGSIAAYLDTDLAIQGCLFVGGDAREGGALWLHGPGLWNVTSSTIAANEAGLGGAIYHEALEQAQLTVDRSILAFNLGGAGLHCDGGEPQLSCVDIFGNEGGDYVGCIADQNGVRGNRSADPRFCDLAGGDYRLKPGSPCLPPLGGTVTNCPILGSEGRGCGALAPGATSLRSDPLTGNVQRRLVLGSVVPNPSFGEIEFSLEMAEAGRLRVELVDVAGRAVRVLVDDLVAAGSHRIQSLAQGGGERPLPAGVY